MGNTATVSPARRAAGLATLLLVATQSAAADIELGANARFRFEAADGAGYGTRGPRDEALLQRLRVDAQWHGTQWQARVELEDVRAHGKRVAAPTDENPLDLRTFLVEREGDGWNLRLGRQELDVAPQRFLGVRDGPNLRQAFDGIALRRDQDGWIWQALASLPVDYASRRPFDDRAARDQRFDLVSVRRAARHGTWSAFYARLATDEERHTDAVGRAVRHSLDLRWDGDALPWDWDFEAVLQRGHVGAAEISAWAVGLRGGYTQRTARSPRWGLQLDTASGDRCAGDGGVSTFHPLFANGSYSFTLAGHTGYSNLVQVKPSLTLSLRPDLRGSVALAGLWRRTTHDAVYLQPDVPLRGTAGRGGRYTATYAQMRLDGRLRPNVEWAAEIVRYDAGRAVHAAGGRDSRYAALELALGW
ncbi:MAG TPA: alginate export family protein [Tahibacter sp.]|uniref:alginate export family protein n=1 Tax=Tahibacter sp. TaxID=2056211 RepID=UPI002C4A5195|nr:alginate export family protein [Tahibacter sp.]HSX61511.1 alginate export family protein [Tahibacter sp.]